MMRRVELSPNGVVIDGRDISNLVVAARVEISHNSFPVVQLDVLPDEFLFVGEAVVEGVPLDGIARLRRRFAGDV